MDIVTHALVGPLTVALLAASHPWWEIALAAVRPVGGRVAGVRLCA